MIQQRLSDSLARRVASRLATLVGLAALAVGSPALGQPTSTGETGVISNPDWASLPTYDDIQRHFPAAARAANVGGRAKIECLVRANGTLTGCTIVSEEPAGYGFGEATLQASAYFKMKPKMRDGASVEGGTVRIPVRWQFPN